MATYYTNSLSFIALDKAIQVKLACPRNYPDTAEPLRDAGDAKYKSIAY